MKVYEKAPVEDVIIVRSDKDKLEWEFYLVTPVLIGTARKAGTQRIIDDSGNTHVNLSDVIESILHTTGRRELSARLFGQPEPEVLVKGVDLMLSGKWPKFCAARELDPRDTRLLEQQYRLNATEAKEFAP